MATQKQIEDIDLVLKHIRENAIELIDYTSIDNAAIYSQMLKRAFSFARDGDLQSLVDIGALGLAYKIRNKRLTENN